MHVIPISTIFASVVLQKRPQPTKSCNSSPAPSPWGESIKFSVRHWTHPLFRHTPTPSTTKLKCWTMAYSRKILTHIFINALSISSMERCNLIRCLETLQTEEFTATVKVLETQQNFFISTSCSYFSEISTSTRVQILYSPCYLHLGYSPRYEADTFKCAMSEWGVWAQGLCDAARGVNQPSLQAIGLVSCWISSCILHQTCACVFHNQTSFFFFFSSAGGYNLWSGISAAN